MSIWGLKGLCDYPNAGGSGLWDSKQDREARKKLGFIHSRILHPRWRGVPRPIHRADRELRFLIRRDTVKLGQGLGAVNTLPPGRRGQKDLDPRQNRTVQLSRDNPARV